MKFYGELLVCVLLLLTNLRVFFVNHVRRDPLVSLAPFTFLVAILQVISWGVDLFTAFLVILAFLVLLSNFHAIFRYWERLYVDHYSPLMKVWASCTSIISIFSIVVVIIFAPVELKNEKLGIAENKTKYKGNFRSGFEEVKSFTTNNVIFYEFEPTSIEDVYIPSKGTILFIPDKRGETVNYKPYLQLLAKEGYTVCAADFYTDDCKWLHSFADSRILRRIAMVYKSVTNNQWFMSQREFYNYNIAQELPVLDKMMTEQFGNWCTYYLVSDVMADIAIEDFAKKNPDRVLGTLCLDSIADYNTPGYGCIEQTDPLLARFLGFKRDKNLYIPNLLVIKTQSHLGKK